MSKASAPGFSNEGWWPIQSISDTTILIDLAAFSSATTTIGYSGSTETVPTYFRKTFGGLGPVASGTTILNTLRAGVSYIGGYDTATGNKNGMTAIDARNYNGHIFNMSPKSLLDSFCVIRGTLGVGFTSGQHYYINNCAFVGNQQPIVALNGSSNSNPYNIRLTNITANSYLSAVFDTNGGNHALNNVSLRSTQGLNLLTLSNMSSMQNSVLKNGATYSITLDTTASTRRYHAINTVFGATVVANGARSAYFKNCLFTAATEFSISSGTSGMDTRFFSEKHDQTNYDYIFIEGGTANTEDTDRSGSIGKMWRLVLASSNRDAAYPLDLPVAQFPYASSGLVTVKAWMKKSHATNCNGRLRIKGGQITGYSSDLTATLADNTNWQELTITFTPTDTGVFEVEALAEYVTANANVYIDNITVSQA